MQKAVHITVDEKHKVTRDIAIAIHRDTPIQEEKDYVTMIDFIT